MKLKGFETVLNNEVKARVLVKGDVKHCLSSVYNTYSKAAHGNNGHLILRHCNHSDNQIAVSCTVEDEAAVAGLNCVVRSAFAGPIVQLMPLLVIAVITVSLY